MRRSTFVFWLPPILWATCIFLLSSFSSPPVPKINIPAFDKIEHVAAYGLLGFLITHALRQSHGTALPKAALIAIVLVAVYGLSDEWHQSVVPGRDSSAYDWLADVFGGSLAQLIHWYDARPSQKTNC